MTTDHAEMVAPGTIRLERMLPGPIERIWEYLTDSEKRGTWFASGAMDLRVGGKVELIFRNNSLTENDVPPPAKYAKYGDCTTMEGTVTVFEPPHRLAYTWHELEHNIEDSEVTFELETVGDRVRLVLTHRGLSRTDLVPVSSGWHGHLDILIARTEGFEPAGFWATAIRLEEEYGERYAES